MGDDIQFEEVDRHSFTSKKNDKGENEAFVLNEMSGGQYMKDGDFKLFINRTDKRKGLVVNKPEDILALIMPLKRADERYNK